ncbi:hypothetical protein PR048_007054 [Dryococelus australis]|uniref:Uncharacterized protein n=1 Tax=Dryococelus australis TaxID=614101 RepID=A0ABQ9ICL2_9NEOP|nr:hypothetical protein PR048_007054 [Dryococelus australis]
MFADVECVSWFFQITDLCGASRVTHFGRRQFYLALKLIAAFQAGLPLRPELFHGPQDIPLPHFGRHINSLGWCMLMDVEQVVGIRYELSKVGFTLICSNFV